MSGNFQTFERSGAPTEPCIRSRSADQLAMAVAEADIRILLMVLVHFTGDLRWIESPFLPKRDINLIPDLDAGLSPEICERVRAAVVERLSDPAPPAMPDPDPETMRRMTSVCLGEQVPPEYVEMNREEMGFAPRVVPFSRTHSARKLADYNVLIVGAGVCGLALGATLSQMGIPFEIVEKNEDLGGTWLVNTYPGCGVDTPNHSYSFSFGPRYAWSRYFSPREEVRDYLNEVADQFGLRRNIRFGARLLSSRWDAAACRWVSEIQTPSGREERRSTFLVSAIGQLNDPSVPKIEGAESFAGPSFHSVAWPGDLDVTGRRLAVIGTGATAMQMVPSIADRVGHVDVYQRSPQWSRPIKGYSEPIPDGAQWLLKNVPFYSEWFRFTMFWRYGDGLLPLLRKDPDWPHSDRSVNRVNDRHRADLEAFIRSELEGRPDLIEKCVPGYPPYGKRILLDNNWYRTLRHPSVELVTEPIRQIEPQGIRTADGVLHPADVLIYATGFKVTEMAARLNIAGTDGTLADVWADENLTAYLGMMVPAFPNFFCMLGPNSGPGHGGSVIFQAECQSRYISSCLAQMVDRGIGAIDVRKPVHDAYVARVDAEHEQLIWTHPGMTTYYRNRHGRVFSVMPWRFVDYWRMTHDADLNEFEVVEA